MSALATPRLTLAEARRILDDAVRDRSYVDETGLGPDVQRFLVYFRMELGKTEQTCTSYEYCLARLAVYYPDLTIQDFDGKHGTTLIRDFLRRFYADVAPGTWNTRVSTVKAFFKWAFEESRIDYNPAAILRYRQVPETSRRAHAQSKLEALAAAQTERRDRIAVQLLGQLGLRRGELRQVQFKHLDPDTKQLTVFGKGGTVRPLPVPGDLYAMFLRERLERQAHPDEYLLYPYKLGMLGRYPARYLGVIWEDRLRPLSMSGMDKWWKRVLDRAGMEPFPMHEMRHSAGTNFWRQTHDLLMTQKMMRHKKPETTARVYVHDDQADLEEAFAQLPEWGLE